MTKKPRKKARLRRETDELPRAQPLEIHFEEGPLRKEVRRAITKGEPTLEVVVEPNREKSIEDVRVRLERANVGEITGSTDRYIFIRGTPDSIRKLESEKDIFSVWLDKKTKAFGLQEAKAFGLQEEFPWLVSLEDSLRTIGVDAVWRTYHALGDRVRWAVLDSGIYSRHTGFGPNGAGVVDERMAQDCTGGADPGPADFHGTHVAGILGQIAPHVTMESHKVLGKDGGSSRMIVQALYNIRKRNEESLHRSDRLEVHGVNLSLGGYPDVESYAVGWSPESREAARLMEQGCLVVVAAGNEGYRNFYVKGLQETEICPCFVLSSIGDPGVAQEVITVGSTHAKRPWSYGVSYFSSKGPTGDGRPKPDLVAPGERIVSFDDHGRVDKEATGTSMAAPHVSGALALFLSHYVAYQGRSEDVKRMLLASCVDLGRDASFQGHGLLDAFRFFQSV